MRISGVNKTNFKGFWVFKDPTMYEYNARENKKYFHQDAYYYTFNYESPGYELLKIHGQAKYAPPREEKSSDDPNAPTNVYYTSVHFGEKLDLSEWEFTSKTGIHMHGPFPASALETFYRPLYISKHPEVMELLREHGVTEITSKDND